MRLRALGVVVSGFHLEATVVIAPRNACVTRVQEVRVGFGAPQRNRLERQACNRPRRVPVLRPESRVSRSVLESGRYSLCVFLRCRRITHVQIGSRSRTDCRHREIGLAGRQSDRLRHVEMVDRPMLWIREIVQLRRGHSAIPYGRARVFP